MLGGFGAHFGLFARLAFRFAARTNLNFELFPLYGLFSSQFLRACQCLGHGFHLRFERGARAGFGCGTRQRLDFGALLGICVRFGFGFGDFVRLRLAPGLRFGLAARFGLGFCFDFGFHRRAYARFGFAAGFGVCGCFGFSRGFHRRFGARFGFGFRTHACLGLCFYTGLGDDASTFLGFLPGFGFAGGYGGCFSAGSCLSLRFAALNGLGAYLGYAFGRGEVKLIAIGCRFNDISNGNRLCC